METDYETDNFNQFVDNFINNKNGGNIDTNSDSEGGAFFKKLIKNKIIFFNTANVNWNIFTYDNTFIKDKNDLSLQLKYKKIYFTKEDLYKQINNKGYSCFVGDNQVKLISLISEKVKSTISATGKAIGTSVSATGKAIGTGVSATGKAIGTGVSATGKAIGTGVSATGKAIGNIATQVITDKDVALSATALSEYKLLGHPAKAQLINKIVADILSKHKDEQATYYKKLLENLDVKGLDQITKISQTYHDQTGGDIFDFNISEDVDSFDIEKMFGGAQNDNNFGFNISDGDIDGLDIEDMNGGGFLDFLIGGDKLPNLIALEMIFRNPEKEYMIALNKINAKIQNMGVILNACIVVEENITGKSRVIDILPKSESIPKTLPSIPKTSPSKQQLAISQPQQLQQSQELATNQQKIQCYANLGSNPNETEDELKTKYRKLALKYHPDKCSKECCEESFKIMNDSYKQITSKNIKGCAVLKEC